MLFQVRYTARAKRDLASVYAWLMDTGANEAGMRWFDHLLEEVETLSKFPRRCGLAPESREFPFEVRQLIFGSKPHQYRVLFTIDGNDVNILNVRHGRRKSLTLL